ncbi:D-alanyl-D-alanine carboxypeptidase/D-alanyl-D-alanine endopeptidase [Chitinilyticum piscinae]|uniref:D-alanyl-D-alanine carboxypeptidase/D-alanyl-D-alanine-endopeptidase n=1 Tax=Chitinilyticum piscinae TaxID=2866724 RepID=A0A8J7FMQ2_9NEIS|nr:D-alanyl-D-alanine carboxypeptidase/D-alanyl-D-alanine-endopeptidase [Chitinilyticum piscinae]MBE9609376.1 D-alanyl-D-alanine carboxypeptidase/D-alanyl-D-alanine-endopeptidase [Chitinilyticum piscinae]
MLIRTLFAGALLASSVLVTAAGLPGSVQQSLKATGLPADALGVAVLPLDGGKAFYHRADESMRPASTMKLVTTWAGLNLLGPTWSWQTELLADRKPVNGVLEGNLYLRGSGDPKLTIERMWLLVRELRNAGVEDIRGSLVLDGSAFGELAFPQEYDDDGDSERAFLVPPDALLSNFRTVRVTFDSTGDKVKLVTEPPLNQVRVSNDLAIGSGGDCVSWSRRVQQRFGQVSGTQFIVQFIGEMPPGCKAERYVPVLNAREYTQALFWYLWYGQGGKGSSLTEKPAGKVVPDNAIVLASTRSPDLVANIRDINKFSNNVMARQLFLTVGAQRGKGGATDAAAAQVIAGWLAGQGITAPELVLENGSGLSRSERISPRHMADMLQGAWRSPWAAEFVASLPLVGMDGTMRKRLTGADEAGRAHIKTGTLRDVRAVAGFVQDDKGRNWVVVGMLNHADAVKGAPVLDALIRSVQKGEFRQ